MKAFTMINKFKNIAMWIASLLLTSESAAKEYIDHPDIAVSPLRVVLVDKGLPPFYFKEDAAERGIYIEILEAARKHTGDTFEYIYVPQNRKYLLFESGKVDIEPGVDPSIRRQWEAVSYYSASFMTVDDVLVFGEGKAAPYQGTESLHGKRLGGILGYRYPWFDEAFKAGQMKRDDSPDELTILKKIHMDRVDVGVMYRTIFHYHKKTNPDLSVEVGDAIESRPMMFRFHVAKKDAAERMSRAISIMLKDGTIDSILSKYK